MAEQKRNTIPATRDAMQALMAGDRDSGTMVSGTHRAADVAVSPSDQAHAEMERAVARGACTILSHRTTEEGSIVQWSGWLLNGHLVCQAWFRTAAGHWSRGPSFVVEAEAVNGLKQVLGGLPDVE